MKFIVMFNSLTAMFSIVTWIIQNQSTNRELSSLVISNLLQPSISLHSSVCLSESFTTLLFFTLLPRIFTQITPLNEEPILVLDSNKTLGTFVEHAYAPNGEYCAFTISMGTQNIHKIMVIDVRTGKSVGKCLRLFSCEQIVWSGDSQGFFIYVSFDVLTCS